MEQNQLFPYAHSVSEAPDYDHLQLPASQSNAPGFYPDPNFSSQLYYQTLPPSCTSKSDYIPEQPECNSETKFASDPQTSACSYESACDEECVCESDSERDSSNDEQSENREILEDIVNELYEDLIIEHCFQVHQAFKLGAYIDEENEVESQIPEETSVSNLIKCPKCSKESELKNYKGHIGVCLRLQTRKSNRTVKTKQTNFVETSVGSSSNGRKTTGKKRKQQSKKGTPKNAKVKVQTRDSGKPFPDYPSTSWQTVDYDTNSKKRIGHMSKTGSMKKPNSPAYKPEIKTNIRDPDFSFSRSSQYYKDEFDSTDIDVDTVDKAPFQWTPADFYNYTPPEFSNPVARRSEKDGKIKVTITKSDSSKRKKKKPKFESTYSSHSFDPIYQGPK